MDELSNLQTSYKNKIMEILDNQDMDKLSNLQTNYKNKILKIMDNQDMNEMIYLQKSYKTKILSILNNQDIPFVTREFYTESPNWYMNEDMKSMIDTLVWLTYTEQEKKDILNKNIEEYFNN